MKRIFMTLIFFSIFMLILISLRVSANIPPSVTTNPATLITDGSARLNGFLNDQGTVQRTPVITHLPVANTFTGNPQNFNVVISAGDLIAVVHTISLTNANCGIVSSMDIANVATTKVPNSTARDTTTNAVVVEQWYLLNPPVGNPIAVHVNWTGTCTGQGTHVSSLTTFNRVNLSNPLFSPPNNKSGGDTPGSQPPTAVDVNFTAPSNQMLSMVIGDLISSTGDARLHDMIGLNVGPYGFTDSQGNGVTYCIPGNQGLCGEGGFSDGGIHMNATSFNSVSYIASWSYINGDSLTGTAPLVFFMWGTNPSNLDHTTDAIRLTASNSYSTDIIGLNRGTLYYFKAVAQNEAGIGNGATLSFTTTKMTQPFYDVGWLFLWFGIMAFFIIGAYWVSKHREGVG